MTNTKGIQQLTVEGVEVGGDVGGDVGLIEGGFVGLSVGDAVAKQEQGTGSVGTPVGCYNRLVNALELHKREEQQILVLQI